VTIRKNGGLLKNLVKLILALTVSFQMTFASSPFDYLITTAHAGMGFCNKVMSGGVFIFLVIFGIAFLGSLGGGIGNSGKILLLKVLF